MRGHLTVFRWRGVPVRLHWSLPLGALVLGGFRFVPGLWLGYLLVVVVHEIGHAVVVRRVGCEVLGVDVSALGGACHSIGITTPLTRSLIAWGGVWAQLVVLAAAGIFLAVAGAPQGAFAGQFLHALVWSNLIIVGVNLLPIPSLDGAAAWRLPRLLLRRREEPRLLRVAPPRRRRLPAGVLGDDDAREIRVAAASPEVQAVLDHVDRLGREACQRKDPPLRAKPEERK